VLLSKTQIIRLLPAIRSAIVVFNSSRTSTYLSSSRPVSQKALMIEEHQ